MGSSVYFCLIDSSLLYILFHAHVIFFSMRLLKLIIISISGIPLFKSGFQVFYYIINSVPRIISSLIHYLFCFQTCSFCPCIQLVSFILLRFHKGLDFLSRFISHIFCESIYFLAFSFKTSFWLNSWFFPQ